MDFVKIQTQKDLERYCDIWLPVWIENGYELESYITKGIERFIFRSNSGEDIGCFEFNPYYFNCSPVNEDFPFHHFPILQNKKVMELDKFVIKSEYQGSLKQLLEALNFISIYAINNKFDYVIGLVNLHLYEIGTERFNVPFNKLIDREYSSNKYVPTMLEIKALKGSKFGQRAMKKYIQLV
ncbi:hypothetical protein [Neobacillus vireti]|uniref:hypothetical protein n=1 Tax=Neobacillus vireti TaxID=220686 RepID=UPI002FFF0FEC